ncbi:magnesium chelatase ATPase subunit I [Jiella sonneratiae]|uniref:Mg-protoporphyrin IX chelatase n=1 Tax=Jiella sonneratiae TaxID=2816856 RepID=A0ABS3J5X3_9HYPH|nr:magnesium chelatase ATPase subunit I [Jiella sonneratiae]MBO0905068.1 magnesium chelatase ATPase subunit I [Jiella sonneratiae]
MRTLFPFAAIVGQDQMTLALTIAAVDPGIGGVLVFGDRGTGKSTAVRALAAVLPEIEAADCPYHCDPARPDEACETCRGPKRGRKQKRTGTIRVTVPVVDLPLGATEDRIAGSLDLERALSAGEKRFEPGLLAKAHRGFLYIDEINLLEDHLVDLLLDVAASGENVVEREGLSVRHPARFVLIGSGNPEEGELRPQLLDRFGLSVEVKTPQDLKTRIEVVKRRDAFERDPAGFTARYETDTSAIREAILRARRRLDHVAVPDETLEKAAQLSIRLGTDGLRGEITLMRAARAFAALKGDGAVVWAHLAALAPLALSHRLRRDPLDEAGSATRVERAVGELAAA